MTSNIEEIEKRALELSPDDRALLIRQLILSLEQETEEENFEELWIKEAKDRYTQFREGKTTEKPADQVLKDARNNLK